MGDTRMPDPSDEWLGGARTAAYPKALAVQIKNFSMRLRHAGTLLALEHVKRDILRSMVVGNMRAMQELRGVANVRAVELKFRDPKGRQWWG
jgi:hypothetical protein